MSEFTLSETLAANFFMEGGFEVRKIIESKEQNVKRPDFLVRDAHSTYIVEVKEKLEDEDRLDATQEALKTEGEYSFSVKLEPDRNIENVVKDGKKQMLQFDSETEHDHLIWLHCDGANYDLRWEQAECGLYGMEPLVGVGGDDKQSVYCLYFKNNLFFNLKSIAGVVLSKPVDAGFEISLKLNPFYARYESFAESTLRKSFGIGVFDPQEKIDSGEMICVDSPMSRKDETEVIQYLNNKYDRNLMRMPMNYCTGVVAIKDEDDSP